MKPIVESQALPFACVAVGPIVVLALMFCRTPPGAKYLMVDEAVGKLGELDGAPVKIHGFVVPGSLRDRGAHFVLQKDGRQLQVALREPLPDYVKDQSEVVVEGHIRGDELDGDHLMHRCGGKYEGYRPETAPDVVFQ